MYRLPLFLAVAAGLSLGGCQRSSSPESAKSAPPNEPTAKRVEAVPATQVPSADAPPRATRQHPAEEITGDTAVLTVSDVDIPVGKTAQASLEVRPKKGWKLNTEYPVKVTLSGVAFSVPDRLKFTTREASKSFQLNEAGMRLDMDFKGDSPGTDVVKAEVKYGTCQVARCELHTDEVEWRVVVN